jgi:hypothetical protein
MNRAPVNGREVIERWLRPELTSSYSEAARLWNEQVIGSIRGEIERGPGFVTDEREAQLTPLVVGWGADVLALLRDYDRPEPTAPRQAEKLLQALHEAMVLFGEMAEPKAGNMSTPGLDKLTRLLTPAPMDAAAVLEGQRRLGVIRAALQSLDLIGSENIEACLRAVKRRKTRRGPKRKICEYDAIYGLAHLCQYVTGEAPSVSKFKRDEALPGAISPGWGRGGWFRQVVHLALAPVWGSTRFEGLIDKVTAQYTRGAHLKP